MILSGWKEIARYLGCSIRTAQRWERDALPVRRPIAGARSHVVTDSEDIALWLADSTVRRASPDVLATVRRARDLCAEAERVQRQLQGTMLLLKKKLTVLRKRTRPR
jgi:hypothetical protein